MKRSLLILVILVLLIAPGFILQEDNPVHLTRMEIDIWPDYDRPQVLVIYRVQLSSDISLPVRISLRIPKEAGIPYKVATRDLDGLLYNVEYSLETQGSWNEIILTTSNDELYIEFYDPRMVRTDDERYYSFSWICDYPIDKLVVKVQQPRNSENFSVSPSMGLGELNLVDDLVYYTQDFGSLSSGITFNADVAYTRKNSELSASNLPVAAATPFQSNTGMGVTVSKVINQVLENQGLVVAGSLIFGGILLMLVVSFFAGSWTNPFSSRLRTFSEKRKPEEDATIPLQYCSHCGKRTNPGDRYCRGCGNTL